MCRALGTTRCTGNAGNSYSGSSRASRPSARSSATWYDSAEAIPQLARAATNAASTSFTIRRGVRRRLRSRPATQNCHATGPGRPDVKITTWSARSSGTRGVPRSARYKGLATSTRRTSPTRRVTSPDSTRWPMRTATSSPSSIRSRFRSESSISTCISGQATRKRVTTGVTCLRPNTAGAVSRSRPCGSASASPVSCTTAA